LIPSKVGNKAPLLSQHLQGADELVDRSFIVGKQDFSAPTTTILWQLTYLKVAQFLPLKGTDIPEVI
jgi:hypothetical protein